MALNRTIDDGYHGELPTDDWNNPEFAGADTAGTGQPTSSQGSVDGLEGTYIRSKPVLSAANAAHFLNRGQLDTQYTTLDPFNPLKNYDPNTGASWAGHKGNVNGVYDAAPYGYTEGKALDTLNFGFYNSTADIDPAYAVFAGSQPGTTRLSGFSAFSDAQREAARQAMDSWDELIALTFNETAAAQADINFMNTTTGPAQASAYLPYNYGAFYKGIVGDVAVNPNQASNQQFDEGEYGLTTLIHEIGHSMGLEHPGRYNFGPGFAVTYPNGAEYYQDSNQYSIMSYWRAQETGANHVDWTTTVLKYGSTPGVHDVLAIQRIYGADMTTRTGDDVYGFNNTTGKDTFDFNLTPHPVVTIWDAGGNDTLDLSGYATPSKIDLNPGAFSSAGGTFLASIPTLAEVNAERAEAGLAPRSQASYDAFVNAYGVAFNNGLMSDNIAIAYGANIENAIGGFGDDQILGNALDNILQGGEGNDFLNGRAGNDRLIGGSGNDILDGGAGNDALVGGGGVDSYLFGHVGTDTINGFQKGEKLDLTDIGGQARLNGNKLFVDISEDGVADLTVVVNGDAVGRGDLVLPDYLAG